jgi:hypothetical protein
MLLRPRQKQFVERSVRALGEHGNTLGVAPTGAGKTIMLSGVVGRMVGETPKSTGAKACVLAHRDELTAQNRSKFGRVNPRITTSVVDAKEKSWNGQVTFAMVPTLARSGNLDQLPALDLLVIDEAHHAAADSYRRIIDTALQRNPMCRIYGVTATPNRGDKRGLRPVFSNVADQIRIGELIASGQERRALRVEQGHLDGRQAQASPALLVREVEAGIKKVESPLEALPEEGPLPVRRGPERDGFELAQRLERIPARVDRVAHVQQVQARVRLRVEKEQEPVHVAQALARQLRPVDPDPAPAWVREFGRVFPAGHRDHLLAEKLDCVPDRPFQGGGDRVGVPLRFLLKPVRDWRPLVRDARLSGNQAGHDGQRVSVHAGKDLLEIEPEGGPGGPLLLVDQHELRQAEDEDVSGPVRQLEHSLGEDGFDGPVQKSRLAHVWRELVLGEAGA